MARISLKDFNRILYRDVCIQTFYFTLPESEFGRFLATRSINTQAILAVLPPCAVHIKDASAHEIVEDLMVRIRKTHKQVFRSTLSVGGTRCRTKDPIEFAHQHLDDLHNHVGHEIEWSTVSPEDEIQQMIYQLGRGEDTIYSSLHPNKIHLDLDEPVRGLTFASPRILAPRIGEIPACLSYARTPL